MEDRRDPEKRGIHPDAVCIERARSNRSKCNACWKKIEKDEVRWGLKYAGNPIIGEEVIPLYGSHPMYLYFHAHCGFAFDRLSLLQEEHQTWFAAQTCHLCGKIEEDGSKSFDIRLRCGGGRLRYPAKSEEKILFHRFHVKCVQTVFDSSEVKLPDDVNFDFIERNSSDKINMTSKEKEICKLVFNRGINNTIQVKKRKRKPSKEGSCKK
mmetsp:Transcript_13282/g.15137  ORF Transcript_13282/g.15137 Transcript_13282/m.15137 type:complete len:210 (+) Transcript_13282:315-944(+)